MLTISMVKNFFPGIYLGFIVVYYFCLLPLIFTTMHLQKNLASFLHTLPLGSCRQLMTKRLYKVNYT